MSTGKVIGIVAGALIILMVIVGTCIINNSDNGQTPAATDNKTQLMTPLQMAQKNISDLTFRISYLEDKVEDLEVQLEALQGAKP